MVVGLRGQTLQTLIIVFSFMLRKQTLLEQLDKDYSDAAKIVTLGKF